jgi:hypothetical protein
MVEEPGSSAMLYEGAFTPSGTKGSQLTLRVSGPAGPEGRAPAR